MLKLKALFIEALALTASVYAQTEYSTGLQFLDPGQYSGIPLAAPSFAGSLPPSVDLAPFAMPGNQGHQGSCVGWAVAFALKTYQEGRERAWSVATPDHQFSPSFIYNQIKLGSCEGGSNYAEALNLVTRDGVATLADFPYKDSDCTDVPSPSVRQGAALYRIANWRRVNTLDETEVKTHLADGFPVLIGMPVDRAFMELKGDGVYQGLVGSSLGGHAMAVVGYDDAKGAFRLLNSWGLGWADKGKGWISYAAFRKTVREGYVAQDVIGSRIASVDDSQLEFETIVSAYVPAGTRSVTRTTGNHHCSTNCEGEPTRTNYTLSLTADDGTTLASPRLRCVTGSCEGYYSVLFARLEDGGKRALASWDVWSMPTTWELTADEVRQSEVSRFTRRVELGKAFTVVSQTSAPPLRISGKFATGETFSFLVGQPTLNRRLRLLDFEVQGPETVYRYVAE